MLGGMLGGSVWVGFLSVLLLLYFLPVYLLFTLKELRHVSSVIVLTFYFLFREFLTAAGFIHSVLKCQY